MTTIDDLKYAAMLHDDYRRLYDDYNDNRDPFATVEAYDYANEILREFISSRGIQFTDYVCYCKYKG